MGTRKKNTNLGVSTLNSELTLVRYQSELKLVKQIINLIVSSQSIQDLCRRFVHDECTQGLVQGAHVYSINTSMDIVYEVGYGRSSDAATEITSTWDDSSLLAKCVKSKEASFEASTEQAHLAMPFLIDSVPNACLLLLLDPCVSESPISEITFDVISKMGSFFVEVKPTKDTQKSLARSSITPSKLTPRQIEIISLAAKGLTNGEIGRKISVSESTVRQETIKIYRNLAADGRSEAIAKAKLLSLIA